ncbi:MAG: dihydrofolate reductase [Lachnospiraceae bacterium]|nr:dihydrofolate reductase [Lachnospiraceae bacterium]
MIALIVAFAKNRVIGKNGKIPWSIKGEQKRFKKLTTGNVVIMGRKSYEEIGHPLPNRDTIVVSNTMNYDSEHCKTAKSLPEAIEMAGDRDIYISGGAGLYKEAMDLVDEMYITEIDMEVEGDTYFPEFNAEDYVKRIDETFDGEIPYSYVTYIKKKGLIGRKVTVTVDRKLGTYHPKHPDIYYPVNYGYIKGIMAEDGEEQDAYILGVNEPVEEFTGEIIAILHRNDDVEEKWVVAPKGSHFSDEEIMRQVHFQEQYFDSYVSKGQ